MPSPKPWKGAAPERQADRYAGDGVRSGGAIARVAPAPTLLNWHETASSPNRGKRRCRPIEKIEAVWRKLKCVEHPRPATHEQHAVDVQEQNRTALDDRSAHRLTEARSLLAQP